MRLFAKTAAFAVVLVAISIAIGAYFARIDRSELGVSETEIGSTCEYVAFKNYYHLNCGRHKNPNEVANAFAIPAAGALDAYSGLQRFQFTLSNSGEPWKFDYRDDRNASTGFVADVYNKDESALRVYLIAFRGTEKFSRDWISNASYITQWTGWKDQYANARELMGRVRSDADKWRKSQQPATKASFIATGHSLGGGLAHHIAYGFPCVSAVPVNSSFVINKFRFVQPFDQAYIAPVYDEDDALPRINNYLLGKISPNHHAYTLNLNNEAVGLIKNFFRQHDIDNFAAAMGRIPLCCRQKEQWNPGNPEAKCMLSPADLAAQNLYCTYLDKGKDDACDFTKRPKDPKCTAF